MNKKPLTELKKNESIKKELYLKISEGSLLIADLLKSFKMIEFIKMGIPLPKIMDLSNSMMEIERVHSLNTKDILEKIKKIDEEN